MRAGVKIKEYQLVYTIQCSRCRAKLAFPVSVDSKDAVMIAKENHQWLSKGRKLYCDGCVDVLGLGDKQPKKAKEKPKKDSETIELGE